MKAGGDLHRANNFLSNFNAKYVNQMFLNSRFIDVKGIFNNVGK